MFDKNLEKLATYVASIYDFGGEMSNAVARLQNIYIGVPDDPPPMATMSEQRIWDMEISQHVKKKQKIEDNFAKLFKLIWGQCLEAMRAKLKPKKNFDLMLDNLDAI